jgi:BTB/POZ domain
MATTLSPDSDVTSHHPQRDGSCTKVFDDPDADIILRSCDAQDFRVLRLYIVKSSPVLKGVVQAATSNPSHVAVIPDATVPLPVVKMSDKGTILSCLLTFIFPMSPTLPPTVEEIMELLSVAQKYEMSSVLTHIRGSISLLDPPFIRQENALHVHSLALQYGLRHEAARATRITIQFSLTIENLGDKLDGLTCASLRELQKYHQEVRNHLALDLGTFRTSGASVVLKDLHCLSITPSGIPSWLDDYIVDIINAPSSFDPIIFQMALVSHIGIDSEVQTSYGAVLLLNGPSPS